MRALSLLMGLVLCASCTGCLYTSNAEGGWGVYANSFRNLGEGAVYGPNEVVIACRNRKLADRAWEQTRKRFPEAKPSSDYACGFKAGYADYLDAGGTGEPPGVPPACYRLECYETPEGQQAIQDWFAGFRHGAAEARASGLRDTIVVPVSALPVRPGRPYTPVGATGRPLDETPPSRPAELLPPEKLPVPKPAQEP
jgi:hypothetical protein